MINEAMLDIATSIEECYAVSIEYKPTFSEETLDMAYRFMLIEANLRNAHKPHTFFQVLKNFLRVIASEDPNKFHFDVARRMLLCLDPESSQNSHVVDRLARELVKTCHALNIGLKMPVELAKKIKYEQTALEKFYEPSYLTITELDEASECIEKQLFTKDGLSIWDSEYLKLIASLGPAGKEEAKRRTKKMKECPGAWDPNFWFRKRNAEGEKGIYFFYSSAFLGLAAVLWKDVVDK